MVAISIAILAPGWSQPGHIHHIPPWFRQRSASFCSSALRRGFTQRITGISLPSSPPTQPTHSSRRTWTREKLSLERNIFLALGCRWSFKLATVTWLRCLYFLCCRLCWLCCQVLILRSIQMADKNGCIYSIVTAFPWSWAAAYHRHISTIFTHRSIMFYPFQSIDRLWVKYG